MERINFETATALARERVEKLAEATREKFDLLLDQTRVIEQGWVFFFNTEEFVRTRSPLAALAGNGPIFVAKEGSVHQLPSAISWEIAIRQL